MKNLNNFSSTGRFFIFLNAFGACVCVFLCAICVCVWACVCVWCSPLHLKCRDHEIWIKHVSLILISVLKRVWKHMCSCVCVRCQFALFVWHCVSRQSSRCICGSVLLWKRIWRISRTIGRSIPACIFHHLSRALCLGVGWADGLWLLTTLTHTTHTHSVNHVAMQVISGCRRSVRSV